MASKIPYGDRQAIVRAAIMRRAERRQTVTYSELGNEVHIPPTGPWKPILDAIALEERNAGRPDITFLVVSKTTGLPSQTDFISSKKPTDEQRQRAWAEFERIWDTYAIDC